MKDRAFYIKILIEKAAEKAKTDLTWRGFKELASILSEAAKETFDAGTLKSYYDHKNGDSKPREAKLNLIAKYIDGKTFRAFCDDLDEKNDPVLQSMVGNYYSYVRMNHEEGNLLRSPVKITMNNGHIFYHQKGGRLEFSGRMEKHEGCLFILMDSKEGKSFYHVYRIGKRTSPEVLQGIFSGVSTDFIPIGGRAVLMRTHKSFESLKTGVLDIKRMLKSKREEDQTLARYFQHREENNLSIKRPANFNLRDLRGR